MVMVTERQAPQVLPYELIQLITAQHQGATRKKLASLYTPLCEKRMEAPKALSPGINSTPTPALS